ncbi:MAG: divergent polysaccharide deacetylase family protein [Devosiaceae bacterium]|nr:divergent polysaccharide deacetylase family protein [Devosiaceae bacterium]
MADDLSSPLGKKKRPKFSMRLTYGARKLPLGRILFGLSGLIIVGFFARILIVEDPTGGQPTIEVPISSTINSNSVAQEISIPVQISSQEPDSSIIISNEPQTPQIIIVENADLSPEMNANERDEFGNLSELIEETENGPIPRIGPNGLTPFNSYSRPSISPQSASGKSLVAIVVTGMGINEGATMEAISSLPDNITLAFAPYGRSLERTAAAARSGGHEYLLEIPMEPFDYPNSDPGPHTLLTGFTARVNLERLFWLMARTGGYMGMVNNLGARFTSSANDMAPFMEELGTRGIAYLDDGSSNRSLSRQLATANQVPFARASLLLDQNPSRAAILAQLQTLVETARRDGQAIGIISALPVSINTIVSWTAQLDDQTIELVPVSALMNVIN